MMIRLILLSPTTNEEKHVSNLDERASLTKNKSIRVVRVSKSHTRLAV